MDPTDIVIEGNVQGQPKLNGNEWKARISQTAPESRNITVTIDISSLDSDGREILSGIQAAERIRLRVGFDCAISRSLTTLHVKAKTGFSLSDGSHDFVLACF